MNAGGVLWGTQAASEAFQKLNHGGKSSMLVHRQVLWVIPNLMLYSSSKFAVRGMTQIAARDLADYGITVNAYAPGIVKTPMMMDIAHQVGANAGKDDEWGCKPFSKDIALKRLSEPEDVSAVVSFLASDDANYITGQTIIVDGGMQFQ